MALYHPRLRTLILAFIRENPGQTSRQMADALGISLQYASNSAKLYEQKGLVKRKRFLCAQKANVGLWTNWPVEPKGGK